MHKGVIYSFRYCNPFKLLASNIKLPYIFLQFVNTFLVFFFMGVGQFFVVVWVAIGVVIAAGCCCGTRSPGGGGLQPTAMAKALAEAMATATAIATSR